MKKLLLSIFFLNLLVAYISAAPTDRFKTFVNNYSTSTIRDFIGYPAGSEYHHNDILNVGNFYILPSTPSIVNIVNNEEDPLDYAQVAFESNANYPVKIYEGDLQVVTTGYGITFPDGSLQTTAGVGSAYNTLSSTGTIIINSDSDNSGDESIYFRTKGATQRMIIEGISGNIGVGTTNPTKKFQIHNSGTDNNLYVSGNAPSIVIGNDVYFSSSTMTTFHVLATSNGQFGLPNAGDSALFNFGASRGDLYLDANYQSPAGNKDIIMQSIAGNGNVGIGTTTPTSKLFVNDDAATSGTSAEFMRDVDDTGEYNAITITQASAGAFLGFVYSTTTANQYTNLQIGGDTLGVGLNVRKGGNVGIGVTNPGYKLEVNGDIGYSSPQTRYLSFSASAFSPDQDAGALLFPTYNELASSTTTFPGSYFYHCLKLPHNSTITRIDMYYYKGTASDSIKIDLWRVPIGVTSRLQMCNVSATNIGRSSDGTTSITSPIIDNNNYYYFIHLTINPDTNVSNAIFSTIKITYTVVEPLP